jgi:ABC-type amino acid transport substrate-binding protein
MRKNFLMVALAFWSQFFLPGEAGAQHGGAAAPLTVGVYVSRPFVIPMTDGTFQGMAVELWETIGKSLGISSKYVQYRSLKELLEATERKDVDVVLTNLTVSHERAARLAISYPWFDGGIRVMVSKKQKSTVFDELLHSERIKIYLWLSGLMIALTVLITLVRRRIDRGFTREWKTGLAKSFHGLIRSAKSDEKSLGYFFGWVGYILSALWMLAGVFLIAYVTSTLTAAMTSVYLHPRINSLRDLPGRTIGVVTGSVTSEFLHSMGIATKDYAGVAEAINALYAQELEAVVAPAPVLEYWAATKPEMELAVVGDLFHPEKYAFAANGAHSDLMYAVSLEIIKRHDNGDLRLLKNKYLGPQKF